MPIRNLLIVFVVVVLSTSAFSQTVRIPHSISADGMEDVTDDLNALFNSLKANTTIVFPKNKMFRVEGILKIQNKKNLVIEGNGSSIIANTTGENVPLPQGRSRNRWPRSREHLSIENSTNITVSGLIIRGAHKLGGLQDDAYAKNLEAQHGINIIGSKNVTLDSVRITHVYGDCIYIGDGAAKQSSDSIVIQHSFLGFTGRQGIAITHGTEIVIQECEFSDVRRTHIDLEGNNSRAVIKNIYIKNNIFRSSRLNWISAAGKGITSDVFVIGNKLIDKEANVTVGNIRYGRIGPFYFINNTSTKPLGNPHGAAWRVINVDGFFAEGNRIAFKKGRSMHLIGQINSTNLILNDNASAHLAAPLKDL